MDTTLLSYLILLASIILLYFPVFALGNIEKMKLDELIRLHPRFTWLKQVYGILLAILFLPLVVLAFYFSAHQNQLEGSFILLFVPFISAFSLFHGILAFTTGVHPIWVTKNSIRYWYDERHNKTWIAEVQIGLAIMFIAVSLFLYFTDVFR